MSRSSSVRDVGEPRYRPATPRQRNVLAVLRRATPPLSLDELAFGVAALEGATADGPLSEADRTALELSLHYDHLPQLDRAGVVAYDAANRVVTDRRRAMPVGGWETRK
ncbi:DUF7344 domain-containing protein [Halopelagius fulvigenes]|uniref:DUF7344 domain-containing protein n=1 Tax=Halopelagius fulvigenes TaxID=1198324 RepID=A0ABD5TZF1_9EURY